MLADTLQALRPIAIITSEKAHEASAEGNYFEAAWHTMSVALYEYRRGNYSTALELCDKCLNYTVYNEPRDSAIYAIKSLCYATMMDLGKANDSLSEAKKLLQKEIDRNVTNRGTPIHGFWFDWAFADILTREAQKKLDELNNKYPDYQTVK